jgi:ubiquitin-conjugating enzyme E2 T
MKAPEEPYGASVLRVSMVLSATFPFTPPLVMFADAVHHPNIDGTGNICLDVLKLPPAGAWKPSLSLATVLRAVRELLAEPNLDDPLRTDVAHQYLVDQDAYVRTCRGLP